MFDYINRYYNVPACIGRAITYGGRTGLITEDRGNYIGVTFDDEKHTQIWPLHPREDGLVYLDEIRKPRPLTRSQRRYKEYLSLDTDMTFAEFLGIG